MNMAVRKEYDQLVPRFQILLDDLDRLELPLIAVLVDQAFHRLQDIIAHLEAETPAYMDDSDQ